MKKQKIILQILALMFVMGGLVRLFANEFTFEIFGMKDLWVDHKYFIYIYRVLGAFVILTGLLLFSISRSIENNLHILNTMKWGFLIIGMTMTIAGYYIRLPLLFYVPDFIFCFALAFYIHTIINSIKITKN